MAARRKLILSDIEILRALEAGENTETLARLHHVTPQAVRWRLKAMRKNMAAPAARRAEEAVGATLDAWRRLKDNLESLEKLKDAAEDLLESPDHDGFDVGPHDYDLEVTCLSDGVPVRRPIRDLTGGLELISVEGKFADPRLLLISATKEIRQQIEAGVRLSERVHNLVEMARFQQEVLDAIAQCDEATAARIRGRLYDQHTLRLSLVGPGPEQTLDRLPH
ncbi:MAG TPA: hypothetical protein VHK68_00805 [Gemmatimonadales bacterium]|jgi:hypothetical protein|nr:hypothetical protein [Gemmatimonadales bacterium]